MDRYLIFRHLLDFLGDEEMEITEASLKNYSGDIVVAGTDGKQTVTIKVAMGGENA